MDWQGQMESEHIMQYTLLGSALVAFLTGYLMSSYQIMLTIYLIGAGITLLVTVTDWAYFNRHPLEWIEPINLDIPNSRQLRLKQQKQQQQQEQFKFVNTYAATKRTILNAWVALLSSIASVLLLGNPVVLLWKTQAGPELGNSRIIVPRQQVITSSFRI